MTEIPLTPAQVKALCDSLSIPWEPGQPEPDPAQVVAACSRLRAQVDVLDDAGAVIDAAWADLLREYGGGE
jgi:hypothetical protein